VLPWSLYGVKLLLTYRENAQRPLGVIAEAFEQDLHLYFSLTGWVVMNRRTTIPLAIEQPIIACTAGLVGKKPTKPCKTDKTAIATPYWTVLDFIACLKALITFASCSF